MYAYRASAPNFKKARKNSEIKLDLRIKRSMKS